MIKKEWIYLLLGIAITLMMERLHIGSIQLLFSIGTGCIVFFSVRILITILIWCL